MEEIKTSGRIPLGSVTAGKVGNSIKVTIPSDADVEAGTEFNAFIEEQDGRDRIVFEVKPKKHVNIWHTDFVKEHDFQKDKEIIGELQDNRVGREI